MNSDEDLKLRDTLNKTVELVFRIGVLKEIRANRLEMAIELLESSVDLKVSDIGAQLPKFAPSRHELLQ